MMMVRVILVDTTLPVRIRPRIETRPVQGHFLSVKSWPEMQCNETTVDSVEKMQSESVMQFKSGTECRPSTSLSQRLQHVVPPKVQSVSLLMLVAIVSL